uniref:Protein kinase domain-containing protein n=1 Tax=Photinus pyralis TaxID=7054 RepID=A0A1Y1K3G5_PHOPY
MSKEEDKHEIPEIIVDTNTKITYKKGRFFGKGGFAKCYEITDTSNNRTYAGKIVSKKLMSKQNQRDKMTQEIRIHKSLSHKHIVGFYGFFEDSLNVYIVLELCRRRSMMELHKRRMTLSEPETRFYMKQILNGVHYLHNNKIIHRDLKLGNLFLNDDLHVKIGDFGLAARIEFEGETKKTLCGTPNYIAPEILNKKGHSFEVDIWSIGCIMYTLLVGKPPFETSSLKETYNRIKKCHYKYVRLLSYPPALH